MIVRNFNLHLNAGIASPLVINVNQYDHNEQWVFTLYTEKGVQYVPADGGIVGVKSDGHGIINTGTVDEDGRVVINETQQMTAAPGRALFELILDGSAHGSANFYLEVEPKPGDQADLSDSDLSMIQQAVESATELAGAIEALGDVDVLRNRVDNLVTTNGHVQDSFMSLAAEGFNEQDGKYVCNGTLLGPTGVTASSALIEVG